MKCTSDVHFMHINGERALGFSAICRRHGPRNDLTTEVAQ
jgi:hypothetical protein